MRRIAALLVLALIGCACATAGSSSKSRTPVTARFSKLEMSPQELRIRVRALIRPTLGIVEESADRIMADRKDREVRRSVVVWKIETTTTLLAAMLRNDPVLALADAWGYVMQVEAILRRPGAIEKLGPSLPVALGALDEIQNRFRKFAGSVQQDLLVERFEARVREWADNNPIEGWLYRRPSMDSAVAGVLATSEARGAFAALGGLDETTADVMTRMDLYTMYLPRLARWEAELAVDDLSAGVDPKTVAADFERVTRAADRIAGVAESAPALVSGERQAAMESIREERLAVTRDLQGERATVLDAIHRERVETLQEIEAIVQRMVDRSSGPIRQSFRTESENFVKYVEEMRKRLMNDTGSILKGVVDHAFYRAVQLLVIAAVLGATILFLHARLARR
jgi:hypothetical protein